MSLSILLQWSFSVPGRNISLSDLILTRVLEEYNLSQPTRSSLDFRTWRTSLPTATSAPTASSLQSARLLTSVTSTSSAKDGDKNETGWIFLEDRGSAAASGQISAATATSNDEAPTENPVDESTAVSVGGQSQPIVVDDQAVSTFDEDGFEMIDNPPLSSLSNAADINGAETSEIKPPIPAVPALATEATSDGQGAASGSKAQQRTLAVRPVSSLLPLLQNLSSPFVLGPSKAARAAAATTAQLAPPTSLPGSLVTVTSLSFPPVSSPLPTIQLTLYLPPSTPAGPRGTIFLAATMVGPLFLGAGSSVSVSAGKEPSEEEQILRQFLEGCLPPGVEQMGNSEKTWSVYPSVPAMADAGASQDRREQEEKRRVTHLLSQGLRAGGII